MLLDQRPFSPGDANGKSNDGTTALLSTLQSWPAVLTFVDQFVYDSSVAHLARATSQNSIFGHAENLLDGLKNERRGDAGKRPIIFVGHSLGGLVIKQVRIARGIIKLVYSAYKCL
jgi:hypothetical protein